MRRDRRIDMGTIQNDMKTIKIEDKIRTLIIIMLRMKTAIDTPTNREEIITMRIDKIALCKNIKVNQYIKTNKN